MDQEKARLQHYEGKRCPRCDKYGTHEWNGQPGARASYLCIACREIWDAEHYVCVRKKD